MRNKSTIILVVLLVVLIAGAGILYKTLGSRYTNMEFNRFLLDIGPAPFSVIKPYFAEWLAQQDEAGKQNGEGQN